MQHISGYGHSVGVTLMIILSAVRKRKSGIQVGGSENAEIQILAGTQNSNEITTAIAMLSGSSITSGLIGTLSDIIVGESKMAARNRK